MAETLTRRVVKATTLLGSTQGINMVCSVVRMKLLAILVGPLGVGLVGALMQTIDTVSRLTQLNIRTSAVRDLAAARTATERSAIRYAVVRYGRALGVLGMLVVLVIAPWVSEAILGTAKYAWTFRIASATVLFQALQGTHHIILQANSRYKAVAVSSATTAVVGLALTVPLYYFLRVDGIAPSVVGYAMVAWLCALYFTRTDHIAGPAPTWGASLRQGRGFLKVGALLTLTSIVGDLIALGFMAYLQREGEDTLGIFQAGYTMLWRYTGIFFMAYNLEFYPRLSKTAHAPGRVRTLVSHQSLVSLAMLMPCVLVVIPLTPWLLRVLFSADFLAATPYVMWGMAGMMIRPLSTAMSINFLAAGCNKTYCITEAVTAAVGLVCNIAGFHFLGFLGLGISTIVWCVLDLAIIYAGAKFCGIRLPRMRALGATFGAMALAIVVSYIFRGN